MVSSAKDSSYTGAMPQTGPTGPQLQTDAVSMSSARASVLNALRERGDSCTVKDLSDEFGLHANTVREHLDALADDGLVIRDSTSPQGRGRPALTYRAAHASSDVARDYELLADVLATHLANGPEPSVRSREAGIAWGSRLLATREVTDASDLPRLLRRLGYEPTEADASGTVILRACPVLSLARRQPDVVCGVHLGFVESLVTAAGESAEDVRMVPMGHPLGCILQLPLLAAPDAGTAGSSAPQDGDLSNS